MRRDTDRANDALLPTRPTTLSRDVGCAGDPLICTRDRLRAQLDELTAQLDDLAAAMAHERHEQEMGLPSLALATLQAHLYGTQSARLALHCVLTQVEAVCARVSPIAPDGGGVCDLRRQ